MPKGILTVSDALVGLIANQVSVLDFGPENAYAQIAAENTAYNAVVADELDTFVEVSPDVTRVYGGADVIAAEDMTELDNPDSSKAGDGYAISFPLTRHGSKTGWTQDFMATNSVDKLAATYLAMRSGDQLAIQRKIRKALYYPVSRPVYLTNGTKNTAAYVDRLVAPQVPLNLFPLLNADGQPVPVGPNGETFDPNTHTHYMASDWTAGGSTATTRDGDVQAACDNVIEHNVGNSELRLFINRADESKIRALPNFVRDYDATITVGNGLTYAGGNLDVRNQTNRRIGTFNGFEVWVKPWTFPGYMVPMALGMNGGPRPLVWRTRVGGLWSQFDFRARVEHFPIMADTMTRDGDCSVWQRHMAAVLYVGGSAYVSPSQF